MFHSTRFKLIISFVVVTLIGVIISLVAGSKLLYQSILNEVTTRISLDLNTAGEIYRSRIKTIKIALDIVTLDSELRSALKSEDCITLLNKIKVVSERTSLDFAGIVTSDRKLVCRLGSHVIPKNEKFTKNPIVEKVLQEGTSVYGTITLDNDFLQSENPQLAKRAQITLIPTPMAVKKGKKIEETGIALAAGIPIYINNQIAGVLYGGILLNRSTEITDTIQQTVFQGKIYRGQSIGTATIFYKDIRIATNVRTPKGNRAIGTMVSKEVRDTVLVKGTRWTHRAFVVNDWYITAYKPINDIYGKTVGMLSVGILKSKYTHMRMRVLMTFILIAIMGIIISASLGLFIAGRIMKPINCLIYASEEVLKGNLNPKPGSAPKNEIGILQNTLAKMIKSPQERGIKQKVESDYKLLQSEKLASIGRLSAGVAHEINNPLTGVLTFTYMLLRRKDIPQDMRSDLETIVKETERVRTIVKGLLDFSRQTILEKEPTDINKLVESTIALVENQALVKGIALKSKLYEGLPLRTVDRNQLQSVILNMLLNSFDATKPGGSVTVITRLSVITGKMEKKGIEIEISDTGMGIPKEYLNRIFDPFFTTKEVGQGTGLGLAVSYGIIERHGGSIRVESEIGKGSTFTIWLPLKDQDQDHE